MTHVETKTQEFPRCRSQQNSPTRGRHNDLQKQQLLQHQQKQEFSHRNSLEGMLLNKQQTSLVNKTQTKNYKNNVSIVNLNHQRPMKRPYSTPQKRTQNKQNNQQQSQSCSPSLPPQQAAQTKPIQYPLSVRQYSQPASQQQFLKQHHPMLPNYYQEHKPQAYENDEDQVLKVKAKKHKSRGRRASHQPGGRSKRKKSKGDRSQTPNPRRKSNAEDKRKSRSGSPGKSQKSLKHQKSNARLNKGRLAEEYLIKDKLGKGNFAVVRRVVRKMDKSEFAAKIISKKQLTEQEVNELINEVQVLSQLFHPNVVKLIDFIDTPRHLYIVLELLTGGELFDRIIARGKFSEQQAAEIAKQMANGLAYLHKKGVVHRDLKPENIIYSDTTPNATIKITDFGLSRDMNKTANNVLKTACGTPGYVAPEILKAQTYDEGVDLWSVGVIIYILLCGFPPFQGAGPDHTNQMFRKIKAGQYSFPSPAWDNVSLVARDCVSCLLTVQPKDRMSAEELKSHPWIQQAKKLEGQTLLNSEFSENLSNYLHKKRFRRGVKLIISLNRMIRAAGLEKLAREQRSQFRERLRKYKIKVKAEQREEYTRQQARGNVGRDCSFMDGYGPPIYDPDETPAIDYSKI